jgi:molybdopterin synthase catalytic subunit
LIKVQQKDFNYSLEVAALSEGNHDVGGVCAFSGLVRDLVGDKHIDYMTLEHYPGMTEKCLAEIEAEAHHRWPLEKTLIIHRYGRLEPGDQIVLVAVSSVHREAAFDACRFLIDFLKTNAPFWKLECTGGDSKWVTAKDTDTQACDRWLNGDKKE